MRRWLLLLMIALLPLRGWVGDAMAAQMLEQRAAPTSQAAPEIAALPDAMAMASAMHDMAHGDAMHFEHDCVDAADSDDSAATPDTNCPKCVTCQVCSSAALVLPTGTPAASAYATPRPGSLEPRYVSAERTLDFKPPIF